MRQRDVSEVRVIAEPLEPRRLLSLTVLGEETTVASGLVRGDFDLATAGDGSFIIAADVPRGSIHRVTAFRYSAAGEPIGEPIPLYAHITKTANISTSMDADGDAVVAYSVSDGDDSGVYVTRISRTGVVARTLKVSEGTGLLSVSMDAAGGFFLAWHEQDGHVEFYQARAFDAAGAPRAEPFVVGSPPGIGSLGPIQIVSLADGSGAVCTVQRAVTSEFTNDEIVTIGRTNTSEVVDAIAIDESYQILVPSLAVQADGSFALTYLYSDHTNVVVVRGSHLRRFTAALEQIGEPFALGASLAQGGNGIHFAVVDDAPDGGYVVSFVEPGEGAHRLYAAHFDAAGAFDSSAGYVPFGTDVAATNPESIDGRFLPRLATGPRGDVIAAYFMRSSGDLRYRRLFVGESVADLRGNELFVNGSEGNDHIIVERVRERLYVNVNGTVQRFNAADVQFLSISGLGGDDDIVNASAIPSTIHGNDGHDTLWGGTSADRLRGLGGNDVLRGGDGDDSLLGESGDDLLNGGDHNDTLNGDSGGDTLYGSSGRDLLQGHAGSDWLYGEADRDVLDSGFGHNYLEGGAGDDVLLGGGEGDTMFGLAGNDWLLAKDSFLDIVRGGLGDDRASVDEIDDVLAVEEISFEKPL